MHTIIENTRQVRFFFGILALITLLLYARVLGGSYGYLWDDIYIFRGLVSSFLEDSRSISGVVQPFLEKLNYFRPLSVFSFWLDAVLAGGRPEFSHAVNLLLFLLNIGLVFIICRRLAKVTGQESSLWRAFFAALIYAVHPAMVESTVWISGRFDVLATTFILSATWMYLGQHFPYWRLVTFAALAFCGMLSKETGVMLGAAIPCLYLALEVARHESPITFARVQQGFSLDRRLLNAFFVVLVLYAILHFVYTPVTYTDYLAEAKRSGKSWDALLVLRSLKFYFHQVLFPFASMGPQHPIESSILSPWSAMDILGNLATAVAIVAVVFYALRRQSVAAWLFITGTCYLLPVLHILPLESRSLGNERFLTTPLAFWAMAVVLVRWECIFDTPFMQKFAAAMNVLSPRKILTTAAVLWLLMFTWTTHASIPVWQNNLTLWTWAHQQLPDDRFSRYNYFQAAALISPETVEKVAQQLMEENGFLYADEYILLARSYLKKGDKKGLDYLEMVREQAGDIIGMHKKPNAEALRISLPSWESSLIAAYYNLSAQAYFQFLKDPAMALQLNETAYWYQEKSWNEKKQHEYELRKTIYQYGMGLFRPAEILRNKLALTYGDVAIDKLLRAVLGDYCDPKVRKENGVPMPVCDQLDSLFPSAKQKDVKTATEATIQRMGE